MNNLTFERIALFILAILVSVALVITTVATHPPTWEIVYVTFVAILTSAYALWWLLLGGEDGDEE